MKPPRFDWVQPRCLDECLEALANADENDARVLAGGQSLMPLLNMRLSAPELLVDVNRVEELTRVAVDEQRLRIGATVRHSALLQHPTITGACPLLPRAARHIGHPAIRNRGTVGGSVAHADPAAELPAVMAALDATAVCRSAAGGRRAIRARELYDGVFTTTLMPGEVLTEVVIPLPDASAGYALAEHSARTGDFALVGAAVVALADHGGRLTTLAVSLFGDAVEVGGLCEEFARAVGQDPAAVDYRTLCERSAVTHFSDAYQQSIAAEVLRTAVRDALDEVAR